ncbi:MAG: hypothetical protein ACLPTF_23065 [Steroidobacteraceae bacterium]
MHYSGAKGVSTRHAGPPLWLLAIIYALLFNAGLVAVAASGHAPGFPGPWEGASTIASFFQARSGAAATCAALQFGSAIPLAIYAATVASCYRFHGVRAAGPNIALAGGLATVSTMLVSSSVLWVMCFPGIAQNEVLMQALYRLTFMLGGPGFSVPFGLLILGIAITGGLSGLLPKWLFWSGVLLGVTGELSWLNILSPQALFLIPLTRFPGFVWLVLAGVWLPVRCDAEGSDHDQ